MAIWIAGAVYSLLGALSLAELAALRPQSGGLAPLVYDELGPYAGMLLAASWPVFALHQRFCKLTHL